MSEWNYVRNNAADSLWGAQITAGATRSSGKITGGLSPARQKWKNIFIDYLSISSYNKNIKNNM